MCLTFRKLIINTGCEVMVGEFSVIFFSTIVLRMVYQKFNTVYLIFLNKGYLLNNNLRKQI